MIERGPKPELNRGFSPQRLDRLAENLGLSKEEKEIIVEVLQTDWPEPFVDKPSVIQSEVNVGVVKAKSDRLDLWGKWVVLFLTGANRLTPEEKYLKLLVRKLPSNPLARKAAKEVSELLVQEFNSGQSVLAGEHPVNTAARNAEKYSKWLSGTALGKYTRETRKSINLGGGFYIGNDEFGKNCVWVPGEHGDIEVDYSTLDFWWYHGSFPETQQSRVREMSRMNGYEVAVRIYKAIR